MLSLQNKYNQCRVGNCVVSTQNEKWILKYPTKTNISTPFKASVHTDAHSSAVRPTSYYEVGNYLVMFKLLNTVTN